MLWRISLLFSLGIGLAGLSTSCGNAKPESSALQGGSVCTSGFGRRVSGTATYYQYTAVTTAKISGSKDKVVGCYWPTDAEAKQDVRSTCTNPQTYTCEGEGSWTLATLVHTEAPPPGADRGFWFFTKPSGTQYFHDGNNNTFCGVTSSAHKGYIIAAYGLDPNSVKTFAPGSGWPDPGRDIGVCGNMPVDTDGDGIYDLWDQCPKEKETVNSYQDADGCPDTVSRETFLSAWKAGFIMNNKGTAFYTNGLGHYCGFASPQHFNMANGNWDEAKRRIRADQEFPYFDYDGLCPVNIPAGYYTDNTSAIYYSNGINATCHIATPEQVLTSPVAYDFPVHTATTLQFTGICRLMSIQAANIPGAYLRHRNFLGDLTAVSSDSDRLDASWNIVPGLANSSCVSFEARNYPGYFLRHSAFRLMLNAFEDSATFRNDATFCERSGRSDASLTSFESVNFPGYYIRHQNFQGFVQGDDSAQARADSTFRLMPSFK